MAPVVLGLRMHFGVAVHFAGGSLVNARAQPLGQAQHVDGPVHAGLDGLHRVVLVVHGRGRAGQIVYLVHFHIKRKGHVMTDEFKAPVVHERFHIGPRAGKKVVHAEHFMPLIQQAFAEMRSQKARTAGDKNPFTQMHVPPGRSCGGRPPDAAQRPSVFKRTDSSPNDRRWQCRTCLCRVPLLCFRARYAWDIKKRSALIP